MKKLAAIIIIAFGLGIAWFAVTQYKSEDNLEVVDHEEVMEDIVEDMEEGVEDVMGEVEDEKEEIAEKMEPAIGSSTSLYQLDNQSTVTYIAQKEWFSKPVEQVEGVSGNVTGLVSIDTSSSTLTVDIKVQSDFKSSSSARDNDVGKLFTAPIFISANSIDLSEAYEVGTEFVIEVPIDININGITKTIQFSVVATVQEDRVVASGSSSFLASDFGIQTPSFAGVFGVNDSIGVKFDITGIPSQN